MRKRADGRDLLLIARGLRFLPQLAIGRIKMRDFKSIRELELELDSVTILVGRSGTGESSLVQAIRFLRNLLLDQNEAAKYELGWELIVPVGESKPRTSMGGSPQFPTRNANSQVLRRHKDDPTQASLGDIRVVTGREATS